MAHSKAEVQQSGAFDMETAGLRGVLGLQDAGGEKDFDHIPSIAGETGASLQ
jgi:hypothetical protein